METPSQQFQSKKLNEKVVFDFYLFQTKRWAGSFTDHLFNLIFKADVENLNKIATAFPEHVEVVSTWRNAPTEKEFFEQYGLKI